MLKFFKYSLIFLLVLIVSFTHAQDAVTAGAAVFIKKGDRYFKSQQYEAAIKQYEKAYRYEKNSSEIRLKIAESYKLNHNALSAEKWYYYVIEEDTSRIVDPKHILNYSQVLTTNGKYEQAHYWLNKYEDLTGDGESTNNQIDFFNNINYYLKDSSLVKVEQSNFSSDKNEYSPTLTKEGILIVSDRVSNSHDDMGNTYSELMLVKFSEDSVSRSITPYLKSGRHNYHDGPVTLAGNTMVITRTAKEGKNKDKLRLFSSSRDSLGNWGEFIPLNLFEDGINEGHPALSSNGKIIYFVSDKTGNKDLYISTISDSGWTAPQNLGEGINTKRDEMFPYLHNDSLLYFSSNGHPGLGGLDVFSVSLKGLDSGQVLNLGAPINSAKDDFGITLSADHSFGYLSSNRIGGLGGDDVYKLVLRVPKRVFIEGFTKGGKESSTANLGNVLIYDQITQRKLGVSDENGFFKVTIDQEKEYDLALKALDKKGYEINTDYYEISFEGLIKNKIDSTHIVHLIITDAITNDTIFVKDQDDKFTYFILEKERKYNFQAQIPEGNQIDISDIQFEGFIKGIKDPIIISEMDIVDHKTQTNLFRSDNNGYFHFPMENGKEYSLVPQNQVAQKIDIWMEGYMKVPDGEFIPPSLQVKNVKGEKYEFQSVNGYFGFASEEGESIKISTTAPDLEKDYEVAEALHFEGFVQEENQPIASGKVNVFDNSTGQLLFQTDEYGFFSFYLDPNVEYNFLAKRADSLSEGVINIRFDGVVRNEKDSLTYAHISIIDPVSGEQITKQTSEGFVDFQLAENKSYAVRAKSIPVKKEVLGDLRLIVFSATDIIKQVLMQDVNTGKIFELSLSGKEHYYSDGVVKRMFTNKIQQEVYDNATLKNFLKEEGLHIIEEKTFYSIYYDYNSVHIDHSSKKYLDEIADLLTRNPSMKMVVSSHADARGTAQYNKELTIRRNESVINYLEGKGISNNRIKQVSNGDLESLENCKICTDKDHDLNRRTDFHVISY